MSHLLAKKMRAVIVIMVVSMLVTLIAACGQSTPATSTNDTKKEEPAKDK